MLLPRLSPVFRKAACALLLAVAGAACAPGGAPPEIPVAQRGEFVVDVVDTFNDVGRSPSVGLDPEGNPIVSYLLLKPQASTGALPAPVVAGQPQPPAVLVADLSAGRWAKVPVTKQGNAPAQGEAPELADPETGEAIPGVDTGLAVDGQAHRHVVWSTPSGVFYSSDVAGAFAAPENVSTKRGVGASIAVSADGTPWIAFHSDDGLQVARRAGDGWTLETVDGRALAPTNANATAISLTGGGEPVVAYGSNETTTVAARSGGAWQARDVPGAGGFGVSLALDKEGNPHVAYYDSEGGVHHAHSIRGGPWSVTDIGETAPPTAANEQADPRWSTGIGVDDNGVHYVAYADTAAGAVMFATNAAGAFAPRPLPNSTAGTNPSLAVSPDGGALAIAWFDEVNTNLDVASTTSGVSLAFSPPQASPLVGPTETAAGTECEEPVATTLEIAAPVGASASGFDKGCLSAPAGKPVSVTFSNQDTGVPHNWDLFEDPSAAVHLGGAEPTEIVNGGETASFDLKPLDEGTYFYRCDIHPTTMTGQLVVQGK